MNIKEINVQNVTISYWRKVVDLLKLLSANKPTPLIPKAKGNA